MELQATELEKRGSSLHSPSLREERVRVSQGGVWQRPSLLPSLGLMGVEGGGHRCTPELSQYGRAAGAWKRQVWGKSTQISEKKRCEQLRGFKIGIILLPSLVEKGRLALHCRASVKTLSPT